MPKFKTAIMLAEDMNATGINVRQLASALGSTATQFSNTSTVETSRVEHRSANSPTNSSRRPRAGIWPAAMAGAPTAVPWLPRRVFVVGANDSHRRFPVFKSTARNCPPFRRG